MSVDTILDQEIALLERGVHQNPHQFLGLHQINDHEKVIRFFAPKREKYLFEYRSQVIEARRIHEEGLFLYQVPMDATREDYRIIYPTGVLGRDPYTFSSTFSHLDGHLFDEGCHYEIYETLGAHAVTHEGIEGVKFSVWAPHAKGVSLVADFNRWRRYSFPMRLVDGRGVYEIFIPGVFSGERYKYAIRTADGKCLLKSDPYAHEFELRPQTASVVSSSSAFCWRDSEWMEKRARESHLDKPMNIYEIHLGSWVKKGSGFIGYKELASAIVPYLKEMGYTHVELLPITEHPLDESWGYQVTGYYAPTSRYGSLEDFQYFINHLHMHHIGVILDWAPGHFPADDFSLASYDGTPLYELDHPKMGWHPEWGTRVFNYGSKQVQNFLVGSALFWLQKAHIDAIRVDAVQSMLFLDYARKEGEWEPNCEGGNENLEAISFLKHLNSVVHEKVPGALMIAEDASIFPGVTQPVEWGGLGFDLKWNLGWMNDTLRFLSLDPIHRKYNMQDLLQSYKEMFQERYVLPISHDEVVHEKKSLVEKMPLDEWHKFAHMRLYYSAALCHPGKNLFFMGTELGQKREWDCKGEIDWHLLKEHRHLKWKKFVREMNHKYLKTPPLWQIDFHEKGFTWIDHNDHDHSVISYLRNGVEESIVCIHNFTPTRFPEYIIRLPNVSQIEEVFNSDSLSYGGEAHINKSIKVLEDKSGFAIKMPPLATMLFKVSFVKKELSNSI